MRYPNLNIVRLLAALQVAFLHVAPVLGWALPRSVVGVLNLFPGVPIFFS